MSTSKCSKPVSLSSKRRFAQLAAKKADPIESNSEQVVWEEIWKAWHKVGHQIVVYSLKKRLDDQANCYVEFTEFISPSLHKRLKPAVCAEAERLRWLLSKIGPRPRRFPPEEFVKILLSLGETGMLGVLDWRKVRFVYHDELPFSDWLHPGLECFAAGRSLILTSSENINVLGSRPD